MPRLLPMRPLARLIAVAGGASAVLGRVGTTDHERRRLDALYRRGIQRGVVRPDVGDELAIRLLHLHPALVWGERWWLRDRTLAHQLGLEGDAS